MKLFYSPGACSLADHIALLEPDLDFELERVDLKSKTTATGGDFTAINPKGYVPALLLDGGELVTESVAVLDWIAQQDHYLSVPGPMGRTRLLETLAYIATEIHKNYKPFFTGVAGFEQDKAQSLLIRRLELLANQMQGEYLFGDRPTVADYYLFVMLLWAQRFRVVVPGDLAVLRERILARPSVRAAMEVEAWGYPFRIETASPGNRLGNA